MNESLEKNPIEKPSLVVAIDNLGSTRACNSYWDNVTRLIRKKSSEYQNIQYIYWNSQTDLTYFTDKNEALEFKQSTGGTDPSVVIDLLSAGKSIEFILVTDGAIAPKGYLSEKEDVEACIKQCRQLLKKKQISFSQLTTYFLGDTHTMNTSVFAAFANALEKDASWKLHLNGEESHGKAYDIALESYKENPNEFINDVDKIENYVAMQSFKWEGEPQDNPLIS